MKVVRSIIGAALVAACGLSAADAQSWNAQQSEVWKVVEKTWEMDKNQDPTWMGTMTHANVAGWGTQNPAPRNAQSMLRWSKFSQETDKMLMYELAPLAIAVSEHAAVAHYYSTTAMQGADGKRRTEHGYCTDTLVKQGDGWVFLGWNCGELKAK